MDEIKNMVRIITNEFGGANILITASCTPIARFRRTTRWIRPATMSRSASTAAA